ncbi:MAG: hypothetical protein U5R06_16865 [candidate division KSB1 bacterium]|nr:hypothetical protein [candidate division KSB1 bacterium]
MEKYSFKILITMIIVLSVPNIIFSQIREDFPEFENVKKVAQTGYQFLKIGSSARSAAMGGAVVTLEGDASTVFSNTCWSCFDQKELAFAQYSDPVRRDETSGRVCRIQFGQLWIPGYQCGEP